MVGLNGNYKITPTELLIPGASVPLRSIDAIEQTQISERGRRWWVAAVMTFLGCVLLMLTITTALVDEAYWTSATLLVIACLILPASIRRLRQSKHPGVMVHTSGGQTVGLWFENESEAQQAYESIRRAAGDRPTVNIENINVLHTDRPLHIHSRNASR